MFTRKLIVKSSLLIVNCLILLTIISYLLPTAHAQAPVPSGTGQAPSYAPLPSNISPTSPIFTDLILQNTFHSFSCLAVGSSIIGQPCLTYQVTKNAQGAVQSVPVLSQTNLSGGALGVATSLIGMLYINPPVRTASYLASVGEGLGIVKTANAQVTGSGAGVLDPILKLWQVSRNISYLVMIIIFVIIGLMVMFRQRINPQTVITAQAALPGLVIGLILITFSYFLAALITDTAFIGTNLVGAYFSAAQNSSSPGNLSNTLGNENILSIMSTFVGATGQGDLHQAVSNVISQLGAGPGLIIRTFASFLSYQYVFQLSEIPAQAIAAVTCGIALTSGVVNPISAILGNTSNLASNIGTCVVNGTLAAKQAAGATAAGVALLDPVTPISWALYVILIAILIYTMFKLLFKLVNNFLSIIFYTITAPFHFLAASLPGRQSIATGWILNMLCNVLAFPAVIAVFYFVNFLLGSGAAGVMTGKPPFPVTGGPLDLTGKGALPLFGGMGTDFIRLIMAYGTLIATPTIPDIICRAIGRVGQAGQLIGQEIGGGSRSGQQYLGQYGQGAQGLGTGLGGQRQLGYTPGVGWENKTAVPGLGANLVNIFKGAPKTK